MSAKHLRTDPACREFRQPRTRLGWWRFDRNRGLACPVCYPGFSDLLTLIRADFTATMAQAIKTYIEGPAQR